MHGLLSTTSLLFLIVATFTPQVTDAMFASAAQRLADYVTPEQIKDGQLYPNLADLRNISLKVRVVLGPTVYRR